MSDEQEQRLQRLEVEVDAIYWALTTLVLALIAITQAVVPNHPQLRNLYRLQNALQVIKPRRQ
jgi:hypothetical protein